MNTVPLVIFMALLSTTPMARNARADEPLSLSDCVAIALENGAVVADAAAKVEEYKARLAEIESVFYPKLYGMTYAAPMFSVHGTALDKDVERRWRSIGDWGPYTHLEMVLAQPIYTFGRAGAGKRAARERWKVEQARLREARNAVALEVKRLYHARLYALSLLPTLDSALKSVRTAIESGQQLYDEGSGKVSQSDLARLRCAALDLERYRIDAEDGADLALAALKHAMGWEEERTLALQDHKLTGGSSSDLTSLDELLDEALRKRPEWAQIHHGEAAARALEKAERRAVLPTLFFAGTVNWDWAPTRDDSPNPYHYDQYNQLTGGAALGLQFNMDFALAKARGEQARAIARQVQAKKKLAQTGIPLQVRKAYDDVLRYTRQAGLMKKQVSEARKWMTLAGAAYATGTGEARDLLEGLAAYVKAKQAYYDSLRSYHDARAELGYSVGRMD